MRGKKLSFTKIKELIEKENKYILLTTEKDFKENYSTSQKYKLNLQCKKCNQKFKRTIFDLKHSISCPWGCYSKRTLKISFKQFLTKFIQKKLNKKFWILFDENWWNKNYKNSSTKNLKLKCKKCKKEFFKSYQNLIIDNSGCPYCARKNRNQNRKLTYNEFLKRAREKHNLELYILPSENWFNENYTSQLKTYLNIYCVNCKKYFKKSVNEFLKGSGCSCQGKIKKYSQNDIIKKLKQIFPEYDYSKVNYKNTLEKIEVICPIHGSFFKRPNDMIIQKQGCPKCSESKGEREIRLWLEKNNIEYIYQYKIKYKDRNFFFDFYIPKLNLAIEYDGIFHFESPSEIFENEVQKQKKRDELKNQYCQENNINLLRIPYWDFKKIDEILEQALKKRV